MAKYLTDEEELQVLKNWWKEHGTSLLLAITAAAAAYFGWQWWNRYQQDYAQQAATLYTELTELIALPPEQTLSDEQHATARFLVEQLQDDYGRSLYAFNASLLVAGLAMDQGDLNAAEAQLLTAQTLADKDTRAIVALRLARVYLAREELDKALSLVQYDEDDSLTGLFAALRGDVLLAKGDAQAARAAYQTALDKLDEGGGLQRRVLEIKLSDLPAGDQS